MKNWAWAGVPRRLKWGVLSRRWEGKTGVGNGGAREPLSRDERFGFRQDSPTKNERGGEIQKN